MTQPSWKSRASSSRPRSESITHAAPLLIAGGTPTGQQPDERALYQELQQKEEAIKYLLSTVTADIQGVVILPFTRGDVEPDNELVDQHSFAQVLILTTLPPYKRPVLDLQEKLRGLVPDGHLHMTTYSHPQLPEHFTKPDGVALISREQQASVTRFLTEHLAPPAAGATRHGNRL